MDLQQEEHLATTPLIRLSFNEMELTPKQICQGIFELAYSNVGDQVTKLNRVREKLVIQKKWLSQTQYKEILDICWLLPGPTSLQIIVTIVTLKMKSVGMGILAALIYNSISWITLTILGLISHHFVGDYEQFSKFEKLLFLGFNAAAAGIMMRDFTMYFKLQCGSFQKLLLISFAAIIFIAYKTLNSIIFCLIAGSIISLYMDFDQIRKKMSSKSEDLFKKISFNFIFGKPALAILILIFCLFWLYFSIYPDSTYDYTFGFYLVGCLVIGPVDAVFAYFLAIFDPMDHISQVQLWLGIPLSFMLPGSVLNAGVYFGAINDGLKGAVMAAIFLHLPCFLALYGMLPQWKYYRDKQGVQRLMNGLVCVATGLDLAIIFLIFQHCMRIDFSTTICIFIVCAFFNYVFPQYTYINILIGGFLANIRRIGLIDYRFLPDRDY